jgi:hypothetical protein
LKRKTRRCSIGPCEVELLLEAIDMVLMDWDSPYIAHNRYPKLSELQDLQDKLNAIRAQNDTTDDQKE